MPKMSILSEAMMARMKPEYVRTIELQQGEVVGAPGEVKDIHLKVKIKSIHDDGRIYVEILGVGNEQEAEKTLQVNMVGRVPSP